MRIRCYGSIFDFHSKGAGSTPALRSERLQTLFPKRKSLFSLVVKTPPLKVESWVRILQDTRRVRPSFGTCLRRLTDKPEGYELSIAGSNPAGGTKSQTSVWLFTLLSNVVYNRSMNMYKYTVTLEVFVEAFDESDAWDAIQDSFGTGPQGAVDVVSCEWEQSARKRN